MRRRALNRGILAAAWALTAASAGCVRLPHPDALVGQWVDSSKTTAADSSIWILAGDGRDLVLRITQAPGGAQRPQEFGRWYLSGALADTTGRALCVVRRPGRDAPSCARFRLDTLLADGRPRRRLVLFNYEGSQHRADRVLLERAP